MTTEPRDNPAATDYPEDGKVFRRSETKKRVLLAVPEDFLKPIEELSSRDNLGPVIGSFRANLRSAIDIGSIPFLLVYSAVVDSIFQSFLMAERIRARNTDYVGPPEDIARDKLQQHLSDKTKETANEALDRLSNVLNNDQFSNATDELLRQIIVMAWGAFEVMAFDLIVSVAKSRQDIVLLLLKNKKIREKYLNINFGADLFEKYSFDLSGSMEKILADSLRMDSIVAIREIFDVVFSSDNLNIALSDKKTVANISKAEFNYAQKRTCRSAVFG
jgi:hypothetical protein